jgi:hypothetical protein
MAILPVLTTNSFDQWRVRFNTLINYVGDIPVTQIKPLGYFSSVAAFIEALNGHILGNWTCSEANGWFIVPDSHQTYDIGTSLKQIRKLYVKDTDFSGDVNISGNLTVTGTQTILNTTNLSIKDMLVTLRDNFTTGTPGSNDDGGIEFLRGTATHGNSQIIWDESALKWTCGTVDDMQNIIRQTEFDALSSTVSSHWADTLKRAAGDFAVGFGSVAPASTDRILTEDASNSYTKNYITLSQIDHTWLQSIGTNTHATIDLHLSNTSNPHATTKSQVGLGNVTDDAQLKRAAGDFASFSTVAPASADILLTEDASNSNAKNRITLSQIDHTWLQSIGTNTHATIDTHLASTSNPHSTTASQVGLGSVTNDAQLKRAAGDFASFSTVAPASGDILLTEDASNSNAKNRITLSQIDHTWLQSIGTNTHAQIDTAVSNSVSHIANTSNPHSTTKAQVGLTNVTDDAQLKRSAGDYNSFSALTLASADIVLFEDASASFAKGQVTVSALATAIASVGAGVSSFNTRVGNVNPQSGDYTATMVGLGNVTNDAQLKRSAGDFYSFPAVFPASGDILLIEDSSNDNAKAKIAISNIDHTWLQSVGSNTHATIDTHLASTSNPHSVTKTQVGLSSVTNDAQLTRAAGDFNTFTSKSAPLASGDIFLIEDSAGSAFTKKKVDVTTLAATMASLGGAFGGVGNMDANTKDALRGASYASGILYMQSADATNPGLVSIGSQTFSGDKTFSGNVNLSATNATLSYTAATGNLYITATNSCGMVFSTNNTNRWQVLSGGDLIPITSSGVYSSYRLGDSNHFASEVYAGKIFLDRGTGNATSLNYGYTTGPILQILSRASSTANESGFVSVCAGRAENSAYGGYIKMYGVSYGTTNKQGNIEITAGTSSSGGVISLNTNGTNRFVAYYNGQIQLNYDSGQTLDVIWGSTIAWQFNNQGFLIPYADYTYNIGTTTLRVGTVYTYNISAGSSALALKAGSQTRWSIDTSGNLTQDTTNGGNILLQKPSTEIVFGTGIDQQEGYNIRGNSVDGKDKTSIQITAGGAYAGDGSRGALIKLCGNEQTNAGMLYLAPGNVAGGYISFYNAGVEVWGISNNNIAQNSTNGGNIQINKTNTGIQGSSNINVALQSQGTGHIAITTDGAEVTVKTHTAYTGSELQKCTAARNTTDASDHSIYSLALANNTAYQFTVKIIARLNSTSVEKIYWATLECSAHCNNSGTARLIGTRLKVEDSYGSPGYSVDVSVSTNTLSIDVTGSGTDVVSWAARIEYQAVSTAS